MFAFDNPMPEDISGMRTLKGLAPVLASAASISSARMADPAPACASDALVLGNELPRAMSADRVARFQKRWLRALVRHAMERSAFYREKDRDFALITTTIGRNHK